MKNPYESYYYFHKCDECGYEDDNAAFDINDLEILEFCPNCGMESIYIKKE